MWPMSSVMHSSTTVQDVVGTFQLIIGCLFAPIVALIFIVEIYRSTARVFAGNMAVRHRTGDGTGTGGRS
jgi:hypothetical protein